MGNGASWGEGQSRSPCRCEGEGGSRGEEAPGETRLSLSQIWLVRQLLLVCLLVSSSITKGQSKHCSQMIGDGHLQLLQQLVSVWPRPPCFLPSEETEAGAKEQGQREGWQAEK